MTYDEMAEATGVKICRGPCDYGTEKEHRAGWADPEYLVVHWNRQRRTRAGTYVFLKLCGAVLLAHSNPNSWKTIFEQSTFASTTARKLGMSVPRNLVLYDRLRVQHLLHPRPHDGYVYEWVHKEIV